MNPLADALEETAFNTPHSIILPTLLFSLVMPEIRAS